VQETRYYLGLFTVDSWREFKGHGGAVMGFNANKINQVAKLRPGDHILCYLTKVSSFVGVMRVAGASYVDDTPIWSDGSFPVRLPVQITLETLLSHALPIRSLAGKLSFLPSNMSGSGWSIHVRTSPRQWKTEDALAVITGLQDQLTSTTNESLAATQGAFDQATRKKTKKPKYSKKTRVGKLIHKSETLAQSTVLKFIGSKDTVLSFNKVTGHSLNVPIAETCQPTAVCLKTCYFATGAPSWKNALGHQYNVMKSIKANPIELAERVALEYDQRGLSFLRWNGGGDLFPESVDVINYLGRVRSDIVIWVVTRIPEMAVQIEGAPNVYIHFSLDHASLSRRSEFLRMKPKSSNYFFSYQCEPNEVPSAKNLEHVSVLFFDNYKPECDLSSFPEEIVCPLNTKADISDACENCRRCFNGAAVESDRLTFS
jgi:hypothetical protein